MFSCCRSNPKAGKREKEKKNEDGEDEVQATEKGESQLNGKLAEIQKESPNEEETQKPEKQSIEAHNPADEGTRANTGTDATLSIMYTTPWTLRLSSSTAVSAFVCSPERRPVSVRFLHPLHYNCSWPLLLTLFILNHVLQSALRALFQFTFDLSPLCFLLGLFLWILYLRNIKEKRRFAVD